MHNVTINYADTVSMYYDFSCKFPYTLKLPKPWKFNKRNRDVFLHHWYLKLDKMYLSFYPDMYGYARLFVTFSLPKLLHDHNTFNVKNFNEAECYELIKKELSVFPFFLLVPIKEIPTSFNDWFISRLDLFIMHPIPPKQREDYMSSYELLTLPRCRSVRYKNTCYVNSSLRPDKKSNKVFRAYPKLQEIADRLNDKLSYPQDVHRQHELYLQTNEYKEDLYRFEFMFRRKAIKYECDKQKVPSTVHEVFQQSFQEDLLSKMISAVGLDRQILHRTEYKKAVNQIFKTQKTKDNALLFARCVRNKQKPNLTANQISKVKQVLKDNNIHFVTNQYRSLIPVRFPQNIIP